MRRTANENHRWDLLLTAEEQTKAGLSSSPSLSPMTRRSIALGVALFVATTAADGGKLRGRVIGVTNGDTIRVLDSTRQTHAIRLNGIDAPESGTSPSNICRRWSSDRTYWSCG